MRFSSPYTKKAVSHLVWHPIDSFHIAPFSNSLLLWVEPCSKRVCIFVCERTIQKWEELQVTEKWVWENKNICLYFLWFVVRNSGGIHKISQTKTEYKQLSWHIILIRFWLGSMWMYCYPCKKRLCKMVHDWKSSRVGSWKGNTETQLELMGVNLVSQRCKDLREGGNSGLRKEGRGRWNFRE